MKQYLLTTGLIITTMAASPYVLSATSGQNTNQETSGQNNTPQTTEVTNNNTGNSTTLSETQKQETDKAIDAQKEKEKQKLEIINETVLKGFKEIDEAIVLLQQKDKEKAAIKALEAATGKFDIALAADPSLGQVPIDAKVFLNELLTTSDDIKSNIQLAINLLKDRKVRDARFLLDPMRDELVISTTYLPMKTYPDAIKQATKQLINGKKEDAIVTLNEAFSTLVIKEAILPLGIIRAENLLKTASNMDKEKNKTTIKKHLKDAEDQLEIATLLGYTDKHFAAYEDIKTQIKALRKEVDEGNIVERLYEKLKASLSNLVGEHSTSEEVTHKQSTKPETKANPEQ